MRGDRSCRCQAALPAALLPDFNPIENAFAKLKALLRKARRPHVAGLWPTIAAAVDRLQPQECQNYFAAAGYEPE